MRTYPVLAATATPVQAYALGLSVLSHFYLTAWMEFCKTLMAGEFPQCLWSGAVTGTCSASVVSCCVSVLWALRLQGLEPWGTDHLDEALLGREGSWFWSQAHLTISFYSLLLPAMSQAVQTNGTQPLSKTWELSLYELQRTPQVTCAEELAFGQFGLYLIPLGTWGLVFLSWCGWACSLLYSYVFVWRQ